MRKHHSFTRTFLIILFTLLFLFSLCEENSFLVLKEDPQSTTAVLSPAFPQAPDSNDTDSRLFSSIPDIQLEKPACTDMRQRRSFGKKLLILLLLLSILFVIPVLLLLMKAEALFLYFKEFGLPLPRFLHDLFVLQEKDGKKRSFIFSPV